ncbi:fumarylacetoacetate hydrolase family protein [Calidifontibacter sp. DB0510]|uniref:Fumarylacetoacetate hydrolase family protein n=1 Tax=Metallococcus carri TaxID=1656884 RepID=A0A967AXF1_9MICO|nr:fumarylacetoacetate hydrolase family protein [Metallococcus carri]NHN54756.1 fumarylacetoacetate hydrolase family protein [Metallococcus carri]NOP37101.1 fumarylacetoacetate hydrolase family protein [Calidifontibacter sp. DB2511S]
MTTRPGKVIAVHVNYRSRAAERGATPKHPSYFLKPGTSVSSGGPVARPPGAGSLTFEGEIALVIGTPARGVSEDRAWEHVATVTVANDLGLPGLKAIDRGSNLRSKGADGYTAVAANGLDARVVDPWRLRLRTWLNGTLVQDDYSDQLLFGFARLVSDLSELITLEAGDVILTGTPAGAGTAKPGDLIEVEVSDGIRSTGRLRTEVVDGPALREPGIAAPPAGTGAPEFVLDEERRRAASSVTTATLNSQLRRRGLVATSLDGVHPLVPGMRLVGRARTLRFIGFREDLFAEHGGGHNAQKAAFDAIGPGEVLVIEARGQTYAGTLGDILALRAAHRHAAGVVSDGAVRDHAEVAAVGLPVFATGAHPSVLGRCHVPWETDVAVTCGGVAVLPGDVLVGDDDGVVVIPPAIFDEVVADAIEQERQERFIADRVAEGAPLEGLYPMNSQWREQYLARRADEVPN